MRRFLLLLLGLTACSPFPATVQVGQLQDDVMVTVDPQWLRADVPLQFRLRFPRSVDPGTLAGVSLRKDATGERLPLQVLHAEGRDVLLDVGRPWARAFTHNAGYTLALDGSVRDASGRPFARSARPLRTEPRPLVFRWEATRVEGAGPSPVVRARVTNLLGEAVPARAVRFRVVCDQQRGTEGQTVYFSSRPTAFPPRGARELTLRLTHEHAFQPRAWPGVPFRGCRNASVEARTRRRAQLSVQPAGRQGTARVSPRETTASR